MFIIELPRIRFKYGVIPHQQGLNMLSKHVIFLDFQQGPNRFDTHDLHQEVFVPAEHSEFHGKAVVAGVVASEEIK
jgi:hypothetical protein